MKKILFINHEETRTGAPKIIFDIAKNMKSDFEVIMVSIKKGPMHHEFSKEFNVILTNEDKIYSKERKFQKAKFKNILSKIKPDLVYGNTLISSEYTKIAKKLRIPTIIHIHELEPSFENMLNKDQIIHFHTVSDVFIAVSKKVQDYLTKIKCNNIYLIYEFVSYTKINEKAEKEIQNKTNVICIGSLAKRKGTDIFFETCKLLDNIQFTWIGGNSEKFLGEQLNNLKYITEKENPFPYLKASDIFVLPSREDPFPLVALEAMALGKPVICFKDGGGIPEAIGNDCGIVVNEMSSKALSDAIVKLSNNQELQKKFGENGRKKVKENYDIEIIMPKIYKLLSSLFNEIEAR